VLQKNHFHSIDLSTNQSFEDERAPEDEKMPQHMIEEVFGKGCNLYTLLQCRANATKAQLRKGYYRAALKGKCGMVWQ
jgi:hypothetical protein